MMHLKLHNAHDYNLHAVTHVKSVLKFLEVVKKKSYACTAENVESKMQERQRI